MTPAIGTNGLPAELLVCNCANCGCLLIAASERGRLPNPPPPDCPACLSVRKPPQKPATKDPDSPWQQNAIRDMEEGS